MLFTLNSLRIHTPDHLGLFDKWIDLGMICFVYYFDYFTYPDFLIILEYIRNEHMQFICCATRLFISIFLRIHTSWSYESTLEKNKFFFQTLFFYYKWISIVNMMCYNVLYFEFFTSPDHFGRELEKNRIFLKSILFILVKKLKMLKKFETAPKYLFSTFSKIFKIFQLRFGKFQQFQFWIVAMATSSSW